MDTNDEDDETRLEVLREALQARNMPTHGNIHELEERLIDAIANEVEDTAQVSAEIDTSHITQQLTSLSIKETRQLIHESGLSYEDCVEKQELYSRARDAMARLMMPAAKCGPISKKLLDRMKEQQDTVPVAARTERNAAQAAEHAMELARARQQQEEIAAEARRIQESRKQEREKKILREKEKRKEKKNRKKASKAKARDGLTSKKESSDEDEEAVEEVESEADLLRLAARRLHTEISTPQSLLPAEELAGDLDLWGGSAADVSRN